MSSVSYFSQAIAAVRRSQLLLWLCYSTNVVLALPLAAAMAVVLESSFGSGLVGHRMLAGYDDLWFRGFQAEATGLAASFHPTLGGLGAALRSVDDLARGALMELHPAILAVAVLYMLFWVFMSGGLLTRYSGDTQTSFFAAAVRHFPRLMLLSALRWLCYALVLRYVWASLSGWVEQANYDNIDERVHFAYVVGKYVVVWGVGWTLSLAFDYARVAAVAEPERSLGHALRCGLFITFSHARQAFGLSAAVFGLWVLALVAFAVFAPTAAQTNGFQVAMAFLVTQAYLVVRIGLRCVGLASQAMLFAAIRPRLNT